ncbi:MAG: S8/S53 family peptidase [Deinococcaceae bacterium]
MKHHIWFGLMALLVSCTPESTSPEPLRPVLTPRVIDDAQTTVLFRGKNLEEPQSVSVDGEMAEIVESNPDSVVIRLRQALEQGDHTVLFTNKSGVSFTSPRGLKVIPGEVNTTNPRYLEPRALVVTYTPKVKGSLEGAWKKANYEIEASWEPFIPESTGICGRVITALKDTDPSNRSTTDGFNALIEELGDSETVDFQINARHVDRGPDAYSGSLQAPVPTTVPAPLLPQAPKLSVAVLDTGLSDKTEILRRGGSVDDAGRSFVFPNNILSINDDALERRYDGTFVSNQNIGHGTAVATALSRMASVNVVPLKVCDQTGTCKSPSVVAAICYAASLAKRDALPVRIMNLSLNSNASDPLVYQALQEASEQGISIVVSSGNQRKNTVPYNPDSYPAYYSVDHPKGKHSAIAGLVAVGSVGTSTTTNAFVPSEFSSEGPWVTLTALGENISLPRADGKGYYSFTGTSFSAPQVAGRLAQILTLSPNLKPAEVKTMLLQNNIKVLPSCPTNRCGAGLLLSGTDAASHGQ